jgi:superfamily II DNA or RNA helicase
MLDLADAWTQWSMQKRERSAIDDEIARIRSRLNTLEAEHIALEARLRDLERRPPEASDSASAASATCVTEATTANSPAAEKLALFRRLFAGRVDVFPVRWENKKSGKSGYAPACANEWVRGLCNKPNIRCGECPNQAFIPVSDEMIGRHLRGSGGGANSSGEDFVAGVYPMLSDETCWFLAADFDEENWAADALAVLETCAANGVPVALERSRSGNGGHVWIFFSEPIAARLARQLGSTLLTATMERRPEISFSSYDRFFPSQDVMPVGGFGNLIALPLQRKARERGNSLFVDQELRPYDDQWAFLSSLNRLSADAVGKIVGEAEARGTVLGVRLPVDDEDADEPWKLTPSRRREPRPLNAPLPRTVRITLADQIYVERAELPPAMVARLVRIAAFQNPEFYRAQAMRLTTHDKPRIISCAELHARHVGLPRGCLEELVELLAAHGIEACVEDVRNDGQALPTDTRFLGELRGQQVAAFESLARHETGVLAATTAFGKTVVAAALIAHRARNTLVLVHRRELLVQWVERLKAFLNIDARDIGTIGGGRRKPTGIIDVALIQSLVRGGEAKDILADYGHLVVDECHHLSASSFELAARRTKARFVLGLSATVARKDGHQPIIFMQCGPVRHRVNAKAQAIENGLTHRAKLRPTEFRLPSSLEVADRPSIAAVYAALAADEQRNNLILDDVLQALDAKRSPVVLTERRDHLEYLQDRFSRFARNLVVLKGGMSKAERSASDEILRASVGHERLILATGRYLGEGFDDSRLDTLFLTMPISWKGTLAQYVGRLHRRHDGKYDALVMDYVDEQVPMLSRMAAKRRAGYRALGYRIE